MDLELVLSSGDRPGAYDVDVSSSAGHATGELRLDVDGLLARRSQLQSTVLASAVSTRRTLETTEMPVRRVGEELFSALFCGAVYGRYTASIATARARGEPLRIVLRVQAPELAALPWEMLFDSEAGEYVCQSEPLVRHVDVAGPVPPLAVKPPLRVLGVVAAPSGLARLDVDAERERLTAALREPIERGEIELVWAPGGHWSDVQMALLDGPWHVVHFIGHGGYDEGHGEGVLAIVGQRGEADLVGAERFTRLLRTASPSPRLVVLNSCSSGEAGSDDLFSSTAASLVRSGVPAVVAMQFTVSDAAARVFSGGFYSAIAHSRTIGEAVRVGRIAIDGISPNTLEWATPVVYLRGDDDPLFMVEAPHRDGETQLATRPTGDADRSNRLNDLYVQALAELRIGNDDNALAFFDSIVALDADYRDASVRRDILRRARRAADAYDEARDAEVDGRPNVAARAYGAVLEIDPEYKDARARAESCRRQQHIVDLVAELRIHAEAGDDRAVISTAEELAALDPDFADPDGLVASARQHLVEQQLEEQYAARYDLARDAEVAADWEHAIVAYAALADDRPDYRDTTERLAACRDRQHIEQLHDRVRRLNADGQWDEVVMLGGDLADIDPDAADPDGLVTAAREKLAERERVDALCDSRFDEAIEAESAEDWQRAIDAYESIVAVRPDHRDTRARLAACHRRLNEEAARREAERAKVAEQIARALERGVGLEADGDWEQAIVAFDEVLEAQPDHVDATRRRAACQRRDEHQQARAKAARERDQRRLTAQERPAKPVSAVEVAAPTRAHGPTEQAAVAAIPRRRPTRRMVSIVAMAAALVVAAGAGVAVLVRDDAAPPVPEWGDAFLSVDIQRPNGVVTDETGALYVTERHRVHRFEAGRGHKVVAGADEGGFSGDGRAATGALLSTPQGLAVDAEGNLAVADSGNRRVRLIDANALSLIYTVAGTGAPGSPRDGGRAVDADLNTPTGVVFGPSGEMYIADPPDQRVRRVDRSGAITTFAGNGFRSFNGDGGPATEAALDQPSGVAIDRDGNVYIADTDNHRIRKVDTDGIITTIAGTGEFGFGGDGGAGHQALLGGPNGVAVDDSGNVYIADTDNHRIRKVDTDGIITTIAGTGKPGFDSDAVPAVESMLNLPRSVTVDRGTLYVADWGNNRIRMIDTDGIISTVAM